LHYLIRLLITIVLLSTITSPLIASSEKLQQWKRISIELEVNGERLNQLGRYLNEKRDRKGRISAIDLINIRRLIESYMVPAMKFYQLVTDKEVKSNRDNKDELISAKLCLINSFRRTIEIFTDDSTIRRTLRDQSDLVTHSPITLYNQLYHERFLKDLPEHKVPWRVNTFTIKDLIMWPLQKVMVGSAYALGKLSGSLDIFDGDLIDDQIVKELIKSKLQPLDILLEKKSSSLTDLTIPGYWGHNAVWLGSMEQLINLGIWDAPELDFFRKQIKDGNSIYEVRRWGLQFENLSNWMNLDSIATLRVDSMMSRRKQEILDIYSRLAAMFNAEYDFLFDYYLPSKLSCGELLFHAYQDIAWPTERKIGLGVITPTLIGELPLYQNSPVSMVAFASDLGDHSGGELLTRDDYAAAMGFRYHPDHPELLARHSIKCRLADSSNTDGAMEQECEDHYEILDYYELEASYR
jgi:hypothetical protein